MANSVACARCHDHKFDPFAMQDYYALAGVFASTKTYFGTFVSPANRVGGDPLVLPRGADQPILHASQSSRSSVAKLKADLAALKAEKTDRPLTRRPADLLGVGRHQGATGQGGRRRAGAAAGDGRAGAARRSVDAPLLERGEVGKPGKPVPRGFPRVVALAGRREAPVRPRAAGSNWPAG